jgi:predicted RNase H-like HicB family nuclease
MNNNGYWIECVPVRKPSLLHADAGFYTASISDFPEIRGFGLSPDRAITKLRKRLDAVRATYADQKEQLPQPHNRLTPPQRLRGIEGWMSVYVDLAISNQH